MSTQRKYADEVLADALAGVVPNASVAERACAQVDALRAINAELLAVLQDFCKRVLPPHGDGDERIVGQAFGERMQMTYRRARALIAKAQEGQR